MWTILKFVKKDLGLLKKDLSNKLGDEVKFYLPKLKFQKFKKKKLHNSEMLLLGDYLFCYHSEFRNNKIINALKYCRGLKYFLSNCFNSQRLIDEFIKKCLNHEDDQGYIRQSFFEFNSNENFEFLSGPFANMMFKIISQQHNKIKILLGDFKTTVCSKEYLFRPV